MRQQKYSLTVRTRTGLTRHWIGRTALDWIQLAGDIETQWILDQGWDPDALSFGQAIEALTHDLQSFDLEELKS